MANELQQVLKPKMQAFADEYLTGEHTGKPFNATAAATWCGYKSPMTMGHKLTRHPLVKEYLAKRMEERSMNAMEVLARFTEIARATVGDVVGLDSHGRLRIDPEKVLEYKRFIKQFGFDSNGNPKVEFHDSHAALRDIAKVLGMLKEGLELSGPGGGAVPLAMTIQFVNPDGSTAHPGGEPAQKALPPGDEEDWSDVEEE